MTTVAFSGLGQERVELGAFGLQAGWSRPVFGSAVEVAHELDLDLLNLRQPLPLVPEQVVELLVQEPDLELGLKVDVVVVPGPDTAVIRLRSERR